MRDIEQYSILRVVGLGCLLSYIFVISLSSVLFDFDLAREHQLVMTPMSDAGCLCGCVVGWLLARHYRNAPLRPEEDIYRPVLQNYVMPFSAFGLCLASLLKAGYLIPQAPVVALYVGDAFAGFFLIIICFAWMRTYTHLRERYALREFAWALLIACAVLILITLLPQEIGCLLTALVFPFATAVLWIVNTTHREVPYGSIASNPDEVKQSSIENVSTSTAEKPISNYEKVGQHKKPNGIFIVTIVLAFVVSDWLLDFVPVLLNTEFIFQQLLYPALFTVLLVVIFAAIVIIATQRDRSMFSHLGIGGLILIAFANLTFPFLPVGGISLAATAAGQIVIFVFAWVTAMRIFNWPTTSDSPDTDCLIARTAGYVFLGLLCADTITMAIRIMPFYEYDAFPFRYVLTLLAIVLLFVLALILMPRLNTVLARTTRQENNSDIDQGNYSDGPNITQQQYQAETVAHNHSEIDPEIRPITSLEDTVKQFAQVYGLSSRETQIVLLIASGRDVPYIERELSLAKSTVKTHISHIYEKCGVRTRQDLIDLLQNNQWLL